jgi:LEM3 (ligand-effect modulator 3) family / CDC50 family
MSTEQAVSSAPRKGNALMQQRLKSLQPRLSRRSFFVLYLIVGCMFIVAGALLYKLNMSLVEIPETYTISDSETTGQLKDVELKITSDMTKPVYLYVELTNFYQNHRLYVKSRSDTQLESSTPITDKSSSSVSNCSPYINDASDLVYYPCGLIAKSVYNDKYTAFYTPSGSSTATLLTGSDVFDDSPKSIAWSTDVNFKFNQIDPSQYQESTNMWILNEFPPQVCIPSSLSSDKTVIRVKQTQITSSYAVADCDYSTTTPTCNYEYLDTNDSTWKDFTCSSGFETRSMADRYGINNGVFINWMRTASLPTFRKLLAVINKDLYENDVITIRVQGKFDVASFNGTKKFVLATVSPLGGKNYFLAIAFMVVGCLSIMVSVVFVLKPKIRED